MFIPAITVWDRIGISRRNENPKSDTALYLPKGVTMELRVNGEGRSFDGCTLHELIASMGLDPSRVAVELNGDIVPRAGFGDVRLNDGDSLEIVHFVGGG